MRNTFTIFSNSSIILPGFKFTELHALTLAARSYALLTLVYSTAGYEVKCEESVDKILERFIHLSFAECNHYIHVHSCLML